ncbi:MAG: DUF6076 domain-containing protein [Oscillospiraceae bacterium]|nr:DUF6076 domain-containing protein [Oscillospiraceae bacterium]
MEKGNAGSGQDKKPAADRKRPAAWLDQFNNTVYFSEEDKTIYIHVDDGNEYESMQDLIDEYEKEYAATHEIHEVDPEELEAQRLGRIKAQKENMALMEELRRRYEGKIRFGHEEDDSPESDKKPLINVLSGATIRLGYGEGILDFLYADFSTPLLEKAATSITSGGEAKGYLPQDLRSEKEPGTERVSTKTQKIVEDFFSYALTFTNVKEAAYRSVYTAICPPVVADIRDEPKLRIRYRQELLNLQEKYKDLMEFCYDEDFYPEVLGRMMPHERYYLYRHIHHLPTTVERTEQVRFARNYMGHKKEMPYGMEHEELQARFDSMTSEVNETEKEFAEKFGIEPMRVHVFSNIPSFISIQYLFSTVEQILELEFTKMLEQNVRFRKCKRCGKYFIMKGNYDTNYCDRVDEGGTQTCQQIAAQENYKARIADNKAIPIYNKYYKRYAARVNVNQIKEKDFKAWRYQAITKRNECTDGKITPEELTEWMEASFPNRKPGKPKEEQE